MDHADDAAILEHARTDSRACITLDHDFHVHLAITHEGRPSVVFLRIESLNAQQQADLIQSGLLQCGEAILRAPLSPPHPGV
jgi:predicted nuclease of predicted toxin-antitoxin system